MFGRFGRFDPHRRGFTILELLVASLLLSMLVTMLTMIFNQSSMAWNTGVASVNDLEEVRKAMGGYHDVEDDILPGIGQTGVRHIGDSSREIQYRTVSLFRNWNGNGQLQANRASQSCSGRAFDQINWTDLQSFNNQAAWSGASIGLFGSGSGGGSGAMGGNQGANQGVGGGGDFVVGVRSAGPDRQWETDDDITTFPEDVN